MQGRPEKTEREVREVQLGRRMRGDLSCNSRYCKGGEAIL